jgi:peptidoglycan/LPS O-acetylase OafA/YrhL
VKTLDQTLKENRGIGPGFHMLRHALSLVILAHHCRIAVFGIHAGTTYAKGAALTAAAAVQLTRGQLVVELLRPALYALVGMFFALSGFLVVGSALRNTSLRVFFANRALRILPALSVEVTLSALVLGPLVTTVSLGDYFADHRFFRYFGNIVGQITYELPGVFDGNPWPQTVNANLWTLPAEFWCYLFMLVMMATGIILHRKRITIGIIAALAIVLLLTFYDPLRFSTRQDSTHFTSWYIVMMFCFGVLFLVNARRIPLHPVLFVAAAAGYYGLMLFDVLEPLSGVLLTYCMVYIGMMEFRFFDRLLPLDLSYGTYLYGFPITQATIFFVSPYLTDWSALSRYLVIQPVVIALTLLFSVLSWTYIEKPTLGLRKHFLRQPRPQKLAIKDPPAEAAPGLGARSE